MKGKGKNKKAPMSRRQLLGLLGGAGGSAALFAWHKPMVQGILESLTEGIISRSEAEVADEPFYTIIFTSRGGSTSQNMISLRPNGPADGFIQPSIYTRLTGTPAYDVVPMTAGGNTVYLPAGLWESTLPVVGGGYESIMNLGSEILTCRGIETLNNHGVSRGMQDSGRPGSRSLAGAIAYYNNIHSTATPFDEIGIFRNARVTQAFKTWGGAVQTVENSLNQNTLDNIMDPFKDPTGINTFLANKDNLEDAIDGVHRQIASWRMQNNTGARALQAQNTNAKKLFKETAVGLDTVFNNLNAKYQGLVQRVTGTQPGDAGCPGIYGPNMTITNPMDMRTNVGGTQVTLTNLAQIVGPNAAVGNLTAGAAVAEYLIGEKLTRCITIELERVSGLFQDDIGTTFSQGYDAHNVGTYIQCAAQSFKYRALLAVCNGLKQAFEAKGLWPKVRIYCNSEFSRVFRVDGSGSDHGWRNHGVFVMGGGVKFGTIGDVRVNSGSNTYTGTQYGAGLKNMADVNFDMLMMITAMANVCNVQSPMGPAIPSVCEPITGESKIGPPHNRA